VGVQGVILEHHGDVAVLGGHVVDHPAADADLALGDVLQPGHHPQRCGLAGARRADQDHEAVVGDVQGQIVDGRRCARVDLGDVVQFDARHLGTPVVNCSRVRTRWLGQAYSLPSEKRDVNCLAMVTIASIVLLWLE
jgi:hypothetical protein